MYCTRVDVYLFQERKRTDANAKIPLTLDAATKVHELMVVMVDLNKARSEGLWVLISQFFSVGHFCRRVIEGNVYVYVQYNNSIELCHVRPS